MKREKAVVRDSLGSSASEVGATAGEEALREALAVACQVAFSKRKVTIFDDTYLHKVQHRGDVTRYVLVAWFCHPCDTVWREAQGKAWEEQNPLPRWHLD